MFSTKMRNWVFYNKPNLTNVILTNSNSSKHYLYKYSFTVHEISASELFQNIQRMKMILENGKLFQILKDTLISIPRTLKQQSAGVLRIWAHQCECVLAQRLRRGQQMFCLYTRLWEEHALKELLLKMRRQISRSGKNLILSGIAVYNWESNRISDQEIIAHVKELDYIHLLREKTLCCVKCTKKKCMPPSDCSQCKDKTNQNHVFDKWSLFIEKKDIIVWRRLHSSGSGHYEYKVYGSFGDVTAEDFLNVQIDSEYRRKWDSTAIVLEVIEKDSEVSSNSEIIYWEMQWPKLFANRDYVFNRRFMIDRSSNTVVIVSRGTEHPSCPIRRDKVRVSGYWSEMVIKPYGDLEKKGIEFGLTYFDNPGVSIPATVTTWVAMRAMPDFLAELRVASKQYRQYCEKNGKQIMYSFAKDVAVGRIKKTSGRPALALDIEDFIIDNTIFEAQHPIKGSLFPPPPPSQRLDDYDNDNSEEPSKKEQKDGDSSDSNTIPPTTLKSDMTSHDNWKYFKPNYYFS